MKFSIYYLVDPRTQEVRYVGYSKNPTQRYRSHLCNSYELRRTDWDSHKNCWIRSLAEQGLQPSLRIACWVQTHEEAQRLEVALIAAFRSKGIELTNGTTGGDGGSQGPLARIKMRLAKLGKKQKREHVEAKREKDRQGALRRFQRQEEREKQRNITKSQWTNPDAARKKREGIKAWWAKRKTMLTPGQISAAISQGVLRNTTPEQRRANASKGGRGNKRTRVDPMNESMLKSALMKQIRLDLPGFVALRHEDVRTAGIPDISLTGRGKTSWWEAKFCKPDLFSTGIQELTMLRLAAAGTAFYVVWIEDKAGASKRTLIVEPRHVKDLTTERWCVGHDHRFVVEQMRKVHGA